MTKIYSYCKSGELRDSVSHTLAIRNALKDVRAGRTFDCGSLFDPPGFEPIVQVIARLRAAPPAAAAHAAAAPPPGAGAASICAARLSVARRGTCGSRRCRRDHPRPARS